MITALTITGLAAAIVLSDRTFNDLKPNVSPQTLTCTPAKPDATFPVSGDLELRIPELDRFTALAHYLQVGINTPEESCAGVAALLDEAHAAGGTLNAKTHVLLTRVKDDSQASDCRLTLTETVTLTLGTRTPFRAFSSTRTIDAGPCR